MLKKIYAHNYRALQNFTLELDSPSTLLIGKNGCGKSSVGKVLMIMRDIGRGEMEIDKFVGEKDFSFYNAELPMRFELHAEVEGATYAYSLVLEMPHGFTRPRVKAESLKCGGQSVFERELGQIVFHRQEGKSPLNFPLDWHRIGLPIIGDPARDTYIEKFRRYLGAMILISPIPASIAGLSSGRQSWVLNWNCENFSDWLATLLGVQPGIYSLMEASLKETMPDFSSFSNVACGGTGKNIQVVFRTGDRRIPLEFDSLSDGEKCMFVFAAVKAEVCSAGELGHNRFVFWDEPDSFISPWEITALMRGMRKNFNNAGQLLATSHNEETMECFSPENIFRLSRASHLEPVRSELLENIMAGKKQGVADLIRSGEI